MPSFLFSTLHNIPSYEYTLIYLTSSLLMHIWVVSSVTITNNAMNDCEYVTL